MLDEQLLEVREYGGEGFMPVISYGAWRVAIMRFAERLLPENVIQMSRHYKTDEVFVLLQGKCILFIGEGRKEVTKIHACEMEPLKVYNVKKAVWHANTLSKDAVVLVVENKDTGSRNSGMSNLNEEQRKELVGMTRKLWGTN